MGDMRRGGRVKTLKRTQDAEDDVRCIDGPQPPPVCKRPRTSGDANESTGARNGHQADAGAYATTAVDTTAIGMDDSDTCERHSDATALCIPEDMPDTEGDGKDTAGEEDGGGGAIEGAGADASDDASCAIVVEPSVVPAMTDEADKAASVTRIVTKYNVLSWIEAVRQEVHCLYVHLKNARKGDSYTCAPFRKGVLRYASSISASSTRTARRAAQLATPISPTSVVSIFPVFEPGRDRMLISLSI